MCFNRDLEGPFQESRVQFRFHAYAVLYLITITNYLGLETPTRGTNCNAAFCDVISFQLGTVNLKKTTNKKQLVNFS